MAVLQADTNGPYPRGHPLGGRVDLIKTGTPLREGSSNLVDDTCSRETSVDE